MDVYKVKIYPAAKRDLQQIVDYLNTLSAQAALRYYDLLVEQISSLSHMPFRCPRPRDAALAAKGYRYLLVEKYLVFYVVVGDTVQIRRILYARRNYQSVLADPRSDPCCKRVPCEPRRKESSAEFKKVKGSEGIRRGSCANCCTSKSWMQQSISPS